MTTDSLIQPFRRNTTIAPFIIPLGVNPTNVQIPSLANTGITSFLIHNCAPFYIWFAGWRGQASERPAIKENGHYIAPGEKYLGRTQMPQWVAAIADEEPGFPLYNEDGSFRYAGMRCRAILTYGSGS